MSDNYTARDMVGASTPDVRATDRWANDLLVRMERENTDAGLEIGELRAQIKDAHGALDDANAPGDPKSSDVATRIELLAKDTQEMADFIGALLDRAFPNREPDDRFEAQEIVDALVARGMEEPSPDPATAPIEDVRAELKRREIDTTKAVKAVLDAVHKNDPGAEARRGGCPRCGGTGEFHAVGDPRIPCATPEHWKPCPSCSGAGAGS